MAFDNPTQELDHLDTLWFQIAGTLCNLRCNHCFISCSPENHTLGMMTLEQFLPHLQDAVRLGVKEFYFTGGEPFANPDLLKILEATLQVGPATVLTNATLFSRQVVTQLISMRDASIYSLELRVSMDGFSPETNDPLRGPGTFKRIMRGIKLLLDGGFLPIITAMRSWPIERDEVELAKFKACLTEIGYRCPRIKLLPSLKIGQEALRDRGYSEHDYITKSMMAGYDSSQLICSNSRVVSTRGVHVCPILVDQSDSILGAQLSTAKKSFELRHHACLTCYRYGALCSNASSVGGNFETMKYLVLD
ncbi:MAG TPA: radical SAM protein [Chthoniobacterales bacterium]|jgi:molybdenum cofactor biosynthesis enzyme MoaA|nr:radical SAM protein [Chthoniobacterales bacterium]